MAVGCVPNIAKGKVKYYAELPLANDAIVAVPIKTAALPGVEVFKDAASLAAIFSGGAGENTTMTRKTLTNVAITVDNTANEVRVTADNPSWTAAQMAAAGGNISALVYVYVPDTTSPSDATAIPLAVLDCVATAESNALTYQHAANGWYAAIDG